MTHKFNLRFGGRSMTLHTERNCLLGNAIPSQDKLRVLADGLQGCPDELRFERAVEMIKAAEATAELG